LRNQYVAPVITTMSRNFATLRIGGVPEHFNLPWHLTLESKAPEQIGLRVDWTDFATGTGAMLQALAAGQIDLAVLLTEGAALGLARGLPMEAVSLYTTSPLIWGVHVAPGSGFGSLDELSEARFAISRQGSGSHLMGLAMAIDRGWPIDGLAFEIVDDLPGAIDALAGGRADVFLWERFTTGPAVEAGHFRRLGDFIAPWPAWVICAGREILASQRRHVESLVRMVAQRAQRLATASDAAAIIAERYELQLADVSEWLAQTDWVEELTPPEDALTVAGRMLRQAGVV